MTFPKEDVVTDRLRLRPTRPSDAEDVAKACSDPSTREFLTMMPDPYTVDDAVDWIANRASKAHDEGRAQWTIADRESDRLLGSLGFPMVMHGRGVAEVGYWVAPWARRQGIATEAVTAATDWAFANGVHRMTLMTDLANFGSQKVALAAGFRRESTLRGDHLRRDGTLVDAALFARVLGDPPGPAKRHFPDLPAEGLTDGVVRLKPLVASDADAFHAVRVLPEFVRSSARPGTPTYEETRAFVTNAYAQWLAGDSARMTIRDAATDEYAGGIDLYARGMAKETGMMGIHLAPAHQGKGFATRSVRLLAKWAFDEVGVIRVEAGTATWNEASQAIMRRVGFTREGVLRSYFHGGDGELTDNVMWSLLPSELDAD